MIDAHTHILPDIDDGAPDVTTARDMLKSLASQGVRVVCLTPHYISGEPLEEFLSRRDEAFAKIKDFAQEFNIRLLLGSETFLTAELLNKRGIENDITRLCLNESGRLLVELPYNCDFSLRTIYLIESLIGNFNVTPVLAHIERYKTLMTDETVLNGLIGTGCLAQINLSSLGSGFMLRKKLLKFLRENKAHFLGTDCHNTTVRPPEYKRYIDIINKKLGDAFILGFNARSAELLESRHEYIFGLRT